MSEKPPSPSTERRQHERVPARVEVRFGSSAQAAKAFHAFSLNFSAGGLCLRTHKPHEVGAGLHLSVTVGDDSFELEGVVAWVRGDAIGVRFKNVLPQMRARLDAVAASLKKGSP
ncbi:MAG: PilZ domain-containing protein [Myxococcota bacterium]